MKERKCLIGMVIVIILIAAVIVAQCIKFSGGYSVVYLDNNIAYIGKLSLFPQMTLSDAYQFQSVQDAKGQNTLQLAPVSEIAWAPRKMILNRDLVLFYGRLSDDSQAAKTLAEAKK